jgi:hypothetical protein
VLDQTEVGIMLVVRLIIHLMGNSKVWMRLCAGKTITKEEGLAECLIT